MLLLTCIFISIFSICHYFNTNSNNIWSQSLVILNQFKSQSNATSEYEVKAVSKHILPILSSQSNSFIFPLFETVIEVEFSSDKKNSLLHSSSNLCDSFYKTRIYNSKNFPVIKTDDFNQLNYIKHYLEYRVFRI